MLAPIPPGVSGLAQNALLIRTVTNILDNHAKIFFLNPNMVKDIPSMCVSSVPLMSASWRVKTETILFISLFAILTFLSRASFLGGELIWGDESTYILMAQDLLRGNLPYVSQFDLKPPGIYIILSAFMKIFGQNIVAVRICGGIFLFATAVIVFVISQRFVDKLAAGVGSCAMIAATNFPYGLLTTTELVAALFMMAALALIIFRGETLWSAFYVGICLSCATLVRTNLAFVVIAVGALYAAGAFWRFLGLHRLALIIYGLGGLLPLGMLVAVYAFYGHLHTLILSVITVPLSYSSTQMSFLETLQLTVFNIMELTSNPTTFGFIAATILGVASILMIFIRHIPDMFPANQKRDIAIIGIMFISTIYAILSTGMAYEYYLIILYPFGAIATAIGARRFLAPPLKILAWGLPITAIVLAIIVDLNFAIRSVLGPEAIKNSYIVRNAADAIAHDRHPGDKIWALNYHLILFYLNEPAISPLAVHPSNLWRKAVRRPLIENGYISPYEFNKIVAKRPTYIISERDGPPSFVREPDRYKLKSLLKEKYYPWHVAGNLIIYKRKT
jgi:4-amino-4-deoxy-L-arabinose transferase-like glycosyltransferase